jgi:mannose/fructose/N-acetylgalactosamine-specific phosphotransferase system component IID
MYITVLVIYYCYFHSQRTINIPIQGVAVAVETRKAVQAANQIEKITTRLQGMMNPMIDGSMPLMVRQILFYENA